MQVCDPDSNPSYHFLCGCLLTFCVGGGKCNDDPSKNDSHAICSFKNITMDLGANNCYRTYSGAFQYAWFLGWQLS